MAATVSSVPPPGTSASATVSESAAFDERWAAWQTRGAARDRAARRKIAIAAPVLLVAVAVLFYAVLGR
jgi:hypothetical protein